MFNATFFNHAGLFPVVRRLTDKLRWTCKLGYYMPLTGDIGTNEATADFTGCPYGCAPGTFGNRHDMTGTQAEQAAFEAEEARAAAGRLLEDV